MLKLERLKVNDIVFGLCVFDMRQYEGSWVSIYKWIDMQDVKMVNENTKRFVLCVRDEKS